MNHSNLRHILNPIKLDELARSWINEDLPSFDIQGLIVGNGTVSANIYCKQSGILAGVPFVDAVFNSLQLSPPEWFYSEGTFLQDASSNNKITVATVKGPANRILLAERIILNVLCRCSGIATRSDQMRSLLNKLGWKGELAATRKTTPGFRMVEKYGLLVGGAGTHRFDLSSMVMLKDNHVELSGHRMDIIIRKAKQYAGFTSKVEVECSSLKDAIMAAEAGANIVMLDNVTASDGIEISRQLKNRFPDLLIEASGGITYDTIQQYAVPEYDIISMSCLIQGCPSIDFSMKIIDV